jgi:hypothetical protein
VLELWYQAAGEQYGIVVITDNVPLTLQRLYAARREANDPELFKLHLKRSPIDESAIWIVKNEFENGEEGSGTVGVEAP